MRWFVNRTGQGEGPFDEATILGMISRGEVQPMHQICVEGGQTWEALSSHPAFAQATAAPAPMAAQAAPAPAQSAPAAFGAQMGDAANQIGAGVGEAAGAFAGAVGASPMGGGSSLAAPMSGAAGDGFFEQAKASGAQPSAAAMEAAGKGHLFAGALAFLGMCLCGLGGVVGAVIGNFMYKEEPKDPFAQFHINQALVFQGVIWGLQVAIGVVTTILQIVLGMISPSLASFAGILGLFNFILFWVAVIVPLIQMGKAKKGEWSEYPLVGAKVMKMKAPILK